MNSQTWLPPLAERVRPKILDDFYGQKHLLAEGMPLFQLLTQKKLISFILWGPPGTGKTTFVHLVAKYLEKKLFTLNAVQSGIKELREVLEQAPYYKQPILFIDEIHRFNKSQQDALLNAVEKGKIFFIGATTENPFFYLNSAILSRSHVFELKPLTEEEIIEVIAREIKRRRESIEQFKQGGRTDLVEKETAEMQILSGYLPEQLTEDEIAGIAQEVIAELKAASKADKGRVMSALMPRIRGRADGRLVSEIVDRLLERSSA